MVAHDGTVREGLSAGALQGRCTATAAVTYSVTALRLSDYAQLTITSTSGCEDNRQTNNMLVQDERPPLLRVGMEHGFE